LLTINRSNIYYQPRNYQEINDLCNEIYELWSRHQFFGYRRITAVLKDQSGYPINQKKVLRLMRLMGLQAIYPKPRTTIINKKEYKYPYLLNNIIIAKPNQVWATDITYIKTGVGFVYLIALIDWFSRFIISWKLSISMTTDFCLDVLNQGIKAHKKPEIINTDQGSQFTSNEWVKQLDDNNIKISMDGKGRWVDNVYIERFWRTVKQEQIYINPPDNITELRQQINKFIKFYNYQRPHQSLQYKTPSQIYYNDDSKRKIIKF
jgi:putative transposase